MDVLRSARSETLSFRQVRPDVTTRFYHNGSRSWHWLTVLKEMARIDETVGSGIGGVVKIPVLKSTRSLRKGGFDRQSLSGVRAYL